MSQQDVKEKGKYTGYSHTFVTYVYREQSFEQYKYYGEFILQLDQAIVFFVDRALHDFIWKKRATYGLLHKTYILIMDAKFSHCMRTVLHANPFQSTHISWIDFAISHEATTSDLSCFTPKGDKLRLVVQTPTTTQDLKDMKAYFSNSSTPRVGSGFMTASLHYWNKIIPCLDDIAADLIKKGSQEEDHQTHAILGWMTGTHPEWFDLSYGQSFTMIANQQSITTNVDYVLHLLKTMRQQENWNLALDIGTKVQTAPIWTDLQRIQFTDEMIVLLFWFREYQQAVHLAIELQDRLQKDSGFSHSFSQWEMQNRKRLQSNFDTLRQRMETRVPTQDRKIKMTTLPLLAIKTTSDFYHQHISVGDTLQSLVERYQVLLFFMDSEKEEESISFSIGGGESGDKKKDTRINVNTVEAKHMYPHNPMYRPKRDASDLIEKYEIKHVVTSEEKSEEEEEEAFFITWYKEGGGDSHKIKKEVEIQWN